MQYVKYIIGVIVGLFGLFFFERSKRKSAEAIIENLEVKEKLIDLEKTKKSTQVEEDQIEAEKKKIEDLKGKKLNDKELADIIRNFPPSTK